MKLRFGITTTLVLLVAVALLGGGYMSLGVLHMGSIKKTIHITLQLTKSGGLLPTSDVTMRGVRVGQVTSVQTTAAGLTVSLEIDSEQRVPANSPVGVETLSIAGEQYIDFKPRTIAPPYLADGAIIPADRVAYHATVSEALQKSAALFSAFDPEYLTAIIENITEALDGSDSTLDQLAENSTVYAKAIQENKQLIAMLFGNVDFMAAQLEKLKAGHVLVQVSALLNAQGIGSTDKLVRILRQFLEYAISNNVFTPDSAVETVIAKLAEYADLLSGPMSTFGPALESATTPIRNNDVDAGGWMHLWESALDDEGGVRVRVHVKEKSASKAPQSQEEPEGN